MAMMMIDDHVDTDHVDADDDGDADDPLHLEAPAAAAGFLHHCLVMCLPGQSFKSIPNSYLQVCGWKEQI